MEERIYVNGNVAVMEETSEREVYSVKSAYELDVNLDLRPIREETTCAPGWERDVDP